ncbi:MOSC domain-containing protein [Devosia sp. ZB163]|uniref:MOSC domain-containing protein n=1 Tax=Devosia sp. ZB163 TaxID=3025938 RepID=UPI002361A3BB|nr:MOSC domain-containing protein [Devosia sp. ZB163]MDC9825911.1 MOSC domain-containing protein [Devosia sp. ZB163]
MIEELPALALSGQVEGVFVVDSDAVESTVRDEIMLTYAGVVGDRHEGLTRPSNAREPWYPRGTPMRNERQISLLSAEELAEVAATLGLDRLDGGWIGANLVLSGIPHFTSLPPRTLLMFPSGATIRIDGDNGPCRKSGKSIVAHYPDRRDVEFAFVQAAMGKRGLVGWVEREGIIRPGDSVKVRVWRQAIYPAVS